MESPRPPPRTLRRTGGDRQPDTEGLRSHRRPEIETEGPVLGMDARMSAGGNGRHLALQTPGARSWVVGSGAGRGGLCGGIGASLSVSLCPAHLQSST